MKINGKAYCLFEQSGTFRNDGKLPDMQEAQSAFARLFDALCTAVLEKFTEKSTKN